MWASSVTSLRLSRSRSAPARIFSLSFSPPRLTACGISSGRASIASTEPKWRISAAAVTSPTPAMPGTLSTLSPSSDWYSITWEGGTPSFCSTSAGPLHPPCPRASAMGS